MRQSTAFVVIGLLGRLNNAFPLLRRDTEWVTETAVVMQTVDTYVTAWVYPDGSPVATTIPDVSPQAYSTMLPVAPAYTFPATTAVSAPSAPSASVPQTSTWSAYAAPTPSTADIVSWSQSTVYTPPPIPASTYAAPVPTAPSVPPVIATPTTMAPVSDLLLPTGASIAVGLAAAGTSYAGDITYYDTGLGSCGLTSGSSDHIVAISHLIMDAYNPGNPNENPLCGKTVNISYGGQTFPATVVDRCVGCVEGDLDLSEGFFNLVTSGDSSAGRIGDVHWTWAD